MKFLTRRGGGSSCHRSSWPDGSVRVYPPAASVSSANPPRGRLELEGDAPSRNVYTAPRNFDGQITPLETCADIPGPHLLPRFPSWSPVPEHLSGASPALALNQITVTGPRASLTARRDARDLATDLCILRPPSRRSPAPGRSAGRRASGDHVGASYPPRQVRDRRRSRYDAADRREDRSHRDQ